MPHCDRPLICEAFSIPKPNRATEKSTAEIRELITDKFAFEKFDPRGRPAIVFNDRNLGQNFNCGKLTDTVKADPLRGIRCYDETNGFAIRMPGDNIAFEGRTQGFSPNAFGNSNRRGPTPGIRTLANRSRSAAPVFSTQSELFTMNTHCNDDNLSTTQTSVSSSNASSKTSCSSSNVSVTSSEARIPAFQVDRSLFIRSHQGVITGVCPPNQKGSFSAFISQGGFSDASTSSSLHLTNKNKITSSFAVEQQHVYENDARSQSASSHSSTSINKLPTSSKSASFIPAPQTQATKESLKAARQAIEDAKRSLISNKVSHQSPTSATEGYLNSALLNRNTSPSNNAMKVKSTSFAPPSRANVDPFRTHQSPQMTSPFYLTTQPSTTHAAYRQTIQNTTFNYTNNPVSASFTVAPIGPDRFPQNMSTTNAEIGLFPHAALVHPASPCGPPMFSSSPRQPHITTDDDYPAGVRLSDRLRNSDVSPALRGRFVLSLENSKPLSQPGSAKRADLDEYNHPVAFWKEHQISEMPESVSVGEEVSQFVNKLHNGYTKQHNGSFGMKAAIYQWPPVTLVQNEKKKLGLAKRKGRKVPKNAAYL